MSLNSDPSDSIQSPYIGRDQHEYEHERRDQRQSDLRRKRFMRGLDRREAAYRSLNKMINGNIVQAADIGALAHPSEIPINDIPTHEIASRLRTVRQATPHVGHPVVKSWLTQVEQLLTDEHARRLALHHHEIQARREQERQHRLSLRPELIQEMAGRKCSECQRKPARIDDLCKKCARAKGIIVHGKIGGS